MIKISDCLELKEKLPTEFSELCTLIIDYKEIENYLMYYLNKENFDSSILQKAELIINQLIIEHLSILKPYLNDEDSNKIQAEIHELLTGLKVDDKQQKTDVYTLITSANDPESNKHDIKLQLLLLLQKYSKFVNRLYQLILITYNTMINQFTRSYAENAKEILKIYPSYELKQAKKNEEKGLIEVPKGEITLWVF